MKNKIFFKLKVNIPSLDTYVKHGLPCTSIYESELIIQEDSNREILLKISFEDKEHFGDKILRWNHENDFKLLDKFEIIEIQNEEFSINGDLIDISFSDHKCKGISNSSAYYDTSGLKFIIINLTGIKLIYKNSSHGNSSFYLNPEAFDLIELNYRYTPNHYKENFKLEPQNSSKDFIPFNNISFKPEHHFYNHTSLNTSEIIIKKEPRFLIKYNGASELDIKYHVKLLCLLYSFFSNLKISYSISKIYTKNELIVELKDLKHTEIKKEEGIFYFDFSQNPRNLIENVNVSHLLENFEFASKIIDRFNFALKTEGESRFMILYNILEQIRNEYILKGKLEQEKAGEKPNLKNVIEEYKFKTSKSETDKIIKDKLKELIEIIDDEHKDLFKEEVSQKLKPIKVFSMINQFKSLFNCINIDPQEFGLEFKKIKTLRDVIFHGNPIEEYKVFLDEINKYKHFPKFVGIVILKYFGIEDISKIEKYKY